MIFAPLVPAFIIYIGIVLIVGAIVFCIVNNKYRHIKAFRRIGIAALLLLTFARPVIPNGKAERILNDFNVFFVVDNTGSMAAKDMEGGEKYRYEVVAQDIKEITKLFSSSKFSVIALDYNDYQAVPLISNADAIYAYADSLRPKDTLHSSDSDLGKLLDQASQRIRNYNKRYPERKSLVIFMSDGEDIKDKSFFNTKGLSDAIYGGAIIGYGTEAGSTIGNINSEGVIDDSNPVREGNEIHISKLDENNLQYIAGELKLNYIRRVDDGDKITNIDSYADASVVANHSKEDVNAREDLYWIAMIGAVGLMLWEFYAILETLLLERKAVK